MNEERHTPDGDDALIALRLELDYYRRQLDELGGENLRQTYIGSGLVWRLKQAQQGFSALSALQHELTLEATLEDVVERVIRAILRTLGMDRAAAIVRTGAGGPWRVLRAIGLPPATAREVAALELAIPEGVLPDARGMLATSQTPPDAFHSIISAALSLPWFGALSVSLGDGVSVLLVAGRLVESRPFRPPLDQGDLDTLVAIGGMISMWSQNRHLAALREQLVRGELERLAAMERERARIARDMHDEVGSSVTRIAFLTELARADKAGDPALAAHLDAIASEAREVVDAMGEIVWALDPSNDTLDNLTAFIREMASTFLDGSGLELVVDVPDVVAPESISAELRRNVSLVVKEAVNNAVKHAHATTVRLSMIIERDHLRVTVTDDGCGISPDGCGRRGNGLGNMRRRMTDIGGECRFDAVPGCGTVVTIVAPLARTPGTPSPDSGTPSPDSGIPSPDSDSHLHAMPRP
jgi:signal transduction histidine kinase